MKRSENNEIYALDSLFPMQQEGLQAVPRGGRNFVITDN